MVPFVRRTRLPLLPYEKQLAETLDLTEGEYIALKKEALWRVIERPDEYVHVPDIQAIFPAAAAAGYLAAAGGAAAKSATVTAIVSSIVVGAVLTAVSYLLTPKPAQANQARVRNRQLGNITGRDRYAPTYGFQGGQDVSRYGETIPIVFTKQIFDPALTNTAGRYTGGVMISPKLVWSRLFSWGNYQTADLVFLVGQGRMSRAFNPNNAAQKAEDLAGLFIGQAPLDSLSDQDFSWYYYQGGEPNANGVDYSTDSRLTGQHYRHGELNKIDNPQVNVFYAPTFAGGDSEAFSHTYSPSTQLRFGAYNAIPNGTPYRLNWQIASRLDSYQEEAKHDANARRLQIAGNYQMNGTGRNYPRRVGILKYAPLSGGIQTADAIVTDNGRLIDTVLVGDKIELQFGGTKLDKDELESQNFVQQTDRYRKGAVDNEGVRSEISGELEQYDDLLQVGEKFAIGNCLFRVEKRDGPAAFNRNGSADIIITLVCEEIYKDGYLPTGQGAVGLVNRTYVFNEKALPENINGPRVDIGQAWFPLCQQDIASFQNIRQCTYTEIGIRSQVWLRFNGLTNFVSLPGPSKLADLDDRDIQLQAGAIQSYGLRYSFFSIYVRPAYSGKNEDWTRVNQIPLAVKGNAPRDIFNYLRISHPLAQWEFRLRPHTSGELVQIIGRNSDFLRLDTKESFVKVPANINNKSFILYTKGIQERISDIATSPQMVNGRRSNPNTVTTIKFNVTLLRAEVDGASANEKQISNGITKAINNDPDPNASEGVYPNVPYGGTPLGGIYTFDAADSAKFKLKGTDSEEFELRMQLRATRLFGPYNNERDIWWIIEDIEAINISPAVTSKKWQDGTKYQISKTLFDGKKITYTFRLNINKADKQTNIDDAERIFEGNTAISEVSHYGGLITRSCDSNAEHEIVYVNESVDPGKNATYTGCAMAGLKVRSSRNLGGLEQLHVYQKNGILVERHERTAQGAIASYPANDSSNIFSDLVYYLLTNSQAGLGELIDKNQIDLGSFATTGSFLKANKLYYDDVIVEPTNIRDFVASIAPSMLCNMVTRNGKFALEPALPYDPKTYLMMPQFPVTPSITIKALFTDGNIIEDSFELNYLNSEERKPMKVALRYRSEFPNRFPEERTILASYNNDAAWSNAPIEEFSYTHITSYEHAAMVARYFLSVRRNITHTISFKTTPYGNALAPGDYIRVVTQQNIHNTAIYNDGYITEDGSVISSEPLAQNQNHDVFLWDRSDREVKETQIFVDINNKVQSDKNAFFAIRDTSNTYNLVYLVESLQLDQDGLVQVVASHYPITVARKSLISEEVNVQTNVFTIETSS